MKLLKGKGKLSALIWKDAQDVLLNGPENKIICIIDPPPR